MDQINSEISKFEIKIRSKIDEFDGKQEFKFQTTYKNILRLWTRREQLVSELNEKISQIEQNDLIQLNKVIEFNRNKLNNATFLKEFSKLVDELETIHRLLSECVQHDREKQYDQFVTKIRLTDNSIHRLQENLEKNCYSFDNRMYDVFSKEINSILRKMSIDRDNLTKKVNYDLKHIWDQNLVIRREEGDKLVIDFECKLRNNTNQLNEYLNALDKNYLLEHLINNLGKQLTDIILQTILNKEVCLNDFEILSVDNSDTLRIQFINQSTDLYDGELIFECIATLIRFLQMIFESNQLVLRFLNSTFKKIFKLLNEKVLNQLLPSRESELSNYTNYVKRIEELQDVAIAAGCLNQQNALNFSNSINLNFVNKLCSRYLIKARKIVKKDILPTKEIGNNYLIENRQNTDCDINQTLYSFPKCQISQSVEEFAGLLKEISTEIEMGNEHRKDLFLTSRKLCELYIDVSMIKHQKKLNESFAQTAIFHNNCFYLAHELVKLNNNIIFTEEYSIEQDVKEEITNDVSKNSDKLAEDSNEKYEINEDIEGWNLDEPLDFDDLNLRPNDEQANETPKNATEYAIDDKSCKVKTVNMTFNLVDFIPLLRDVGSEYLLDQMKRQRQFILDILQDSKTMQNLLSDQNSYKGEHSNHPLRRAIDQVLDKVFSLRQEILPILPTSVTTRIICTFLNTLIQELFHKILKIEDIPESNCGILLSALNYLENYLNETEETQRLTVVLDDYHKLLEMKFILKANLQEIQDRWDNGDGPLTLAFTAEQLKHMIRALFQNTERRSALLFKIK